MQLFVPNESYVMEKLILRPCLQAGRITIVLGLP